jgi:uncharacterized protein with beta-barrel porin domain
MLRILLNILYLNLAFLAWICLSAPLAYSAPGPCVVTGPKEITCTGDHSAGIASGTDFSSPPDINTLNINSLSTDITPSSGEAGVSMVSPTYGSDLTVQYESAGESILTEGDEAHGILVESHSKTVDGDRGGNVVVTSNGDIVTRGSRSHAIVARSQGRTGGAVDVTSNGDIITQGLDSNGIVAESRGNHNGIGNITVTVGEVKVQGGTGSSVGVKIVGGADNTLTNRGHITTLNGPTGTAITGGGGHEAIENYGTISGGVDLGDGNNQFNNYAGALFKSGSAVHLGQGNSMANAGTFSPGGAGNLATTNITGDFKQADTGILETDVDFGKGQTDRVEVSGKADLEGQILPQPVYEGGVVSESFHSLVLSAQGGVTNSGLGLSVQPTAIVNYQLSFPNATDVALAGQLNFSPSGLNANQIAIGNHLSNILMNGGSPDFGPLITSLLKIPDVETLASSYDQLTPEVFIGLQSTTLFSNLSFSNAMLSCRQRAGEYRFVREGECGWMRFSGRNLQQDRTVSNLGFKEHAFGLSGGMQKAVSENYHLGFGLSYEKSELEAGNSDTDGDQVQAGLVLKGRYGATVFSTAVSGGYGWYSTDRLLSILGPSTRARSDQGIGHVGGHVRIGYVFERSNWYFKPLIDTGVTYVNLGDFRETGAGPANLIVSGGDELYWSVQPAFEIGMEWTNADNQLVRPFLRVGYTRFIADTNPEITAILEGAPVGVAPFQVTGDTERDFADVEAGIDIIQVGGTTFRLNYIGKLSSKIQLHQGGLKVSTPF